MNAKFVELFLRDSIVWIITFLFIKMKQDLPAMTVAENLGTYEHKILTFINIYYPK